MRSGHLTPAALAAIGRVAAVLILIAILVSVWGAVVGPLSAWSSDNAHRLREAHSTLARLKAVVEFGSEQGPALDTATLANHAGDFLTGTEDALIMADLQTRLRALVIARQSEFSSARTLPPKVADGLTYLGVKIQLKGDMRDVQQIIHAIETAAPFLFIERAQLRLDERRILNPGAPHDAAVPHLQAELDVYGTKWPAVAVKAAPRRSP